MRKPRWWKVSLFSYSSGPRSVRGPTPLMRNLRGSFIDVGCGDGEEFGDGGEVGDVVEGLIGAFKKVGQLGVEI